MDKITETILKFLKLDNIVHSLTGYVEDRIELMKLEIREDVAKIVGRAIVMVGLFLIGFMFLVFFSAGLAHFLNRYFSESYAGYWIVAGIYLLGFLILYFSRNSIYHGVERHFAEMIKKKEK